MNISLTPTISLNNLKQTELTNNSIANNQSSTLLTSSLNAPVSSSSFVGFPLLNSFSQEQLTAMNALLPNTQFLSNSLAAPNFTSLNLGSATLLNLKDKTTGLETVSIMPTANNKHFSQPVANLLSQITAIPQSTSVSLRTLSTLSQLFNSSNDLNTSKIVGAQNSMNINVSNSGVTLSSPTKTKFAINLPSALNSMADRKNLPNMIDSLTNRLKSPNFNLSVQDSVNKGESPTSESMQMSTMTSSDGGPVSNGLSGESNTSLNSNNNNINGSSNPNSSYGSNQFLFGRRLAHTRRFVCNQCRKNFVSLAELNRHTVEAHSSFKCTICSAHFTQRSNLQRHSLKHVGFKPFTCNLCKKEYYRKDHLVRHIEVTHPNHDPKMNITVHLTSSECLDYLDRLHAGKQTPSPEGSSDIQDISLGPEFQQLDQLKIEKPTVETHDDNMSGSPNQQI
ncbi:Zinc finger protein [Paragonimus kellicotti]|nr:Zinc finger protein [Paragonimus kellicotti]